MAHVTPRLDPAAKRARAGDGAALPTSAGDGLDPDLPFDPDDTQVDPLATFETPSLPATLPLPPPPSGSAPVWSMTELGQGVGAGGVWATRSAVVDLRTLQAMLNDRDQRMRSETAGAIQRAVAAVHAEVGDIKAIVAKLGNMIDEVVRQRSELDADSGNDDSTRTPSRSSKVESNCACDPPSPRPEPDCANLPWPVGPRPLLLGQGTDDEAYRRAIKAAVTEAFAFCKAPACTKDYEVIVRRALAICKRPPAETTAAAVQDLLTPAATSLVRS